MPTPVIGYKGEALDLLIRQGATFGPIAATLTDSTPAPINLTGATIRAQVRRTAATGSIAATFDVTITNAAAGQFSYLITAANTALLAAGDVETDVDSLYVWDMEMQDSSGAVLPLTYGNVQVFREVTK